jgi:hypothetical protein
MAGDLMKDPIIVEGTGTAHGMTKIWNLAWGCPRKEWLKYQEEQESPEEEDLIENPSEALLEGSIGHAMLERYYRGGDPLSVDIQGPRYPSHVFEKCLIKMIRVVGSYIENHPREKEFSKILGVEEYISTKPNDLDLYPYTGQLDLVVRLNKRNTANLLRSRMVDIGPGDWLVEHKFVGQNNQATFEKYLASTQLTSYLEAYNLKHPKRRAEGVILNMVVKTKKPQVVTGVRIGNTSADLMVLRKTLRKARANGFPISKDTPMLSCDPGRCWDYGQCWYRTTDACLRF